MCVMVDSGRRAIEPFLFYQFEQSKIIFKPFHTCYNVNTLIPYIYPYTQLSVFYY